MRSLALNAGWDLYADSRGNIATLTGVDAVLQDVCTACRLFFGELWYDTTQGVPYGNILAERPAAEFVRTQIRAAAMTVPTVTNAVVTFTSFTGRALGGTIEVTIQATPAATATGFVNFGASQNQRGPVPWYVNAAIGQ